MPLVGLAALALALVGCDKLAAYSSGPATGADGGRLDGPGDGGVAADGATDGRVGDVGADSGRPDIGNNAAELVCQPLGPVGRPLSNARDYALTRDGLSLYVRNVLDSLKKATRTATNKSFGDWTDVTGFPAKAQDLSFFRAGASDQVALAVLGSLRICSFPALSCRSSPLALKSGQAVRTADGPSIAERGSALVMAVNVGNSTVIATPVDSVDPAKGWVGVQLSDSWTVDDATLSRDGRLLVSPRIDPNRGVESLWVQRGDAFSASFTQPVVLHGVVSAAALANPEIHIRSSREIELYAGRGEQPRQLLRSICVERNVTAPFPVAQVVAGYNYTCARSTAGQVKCWGDNNSGQLGTGDNIQRGAKPGELANVGPIPLGGAATQLSAGQNHVCATLSDARVKCWGEGKDGAIGSGDSESRGDDAGEMGSALVAVAFGGGDKGRFIATSKDASCVVRSDGALRCWGSNEFGVLGLGDNKPRGTSPGDLGAALPAVELGATASFGTIAGGPASEHFCAHTVNGQLRCWGRGDLGQLGSGATDNIGDAAGQLGGALKPVDLGKRRAISVAVGRNHTCVITDDHRVYCFGGNGDGQLGVGSTVRNVGTTAASMGQALVPVDLGPEARPVQLALGGHFSCALLADGRVKCWGRNDRGQLGAGDTRPRGASASDMGTALPRVTLSGEPAVQITAGRGHACALLADRTVKCWGDNDKGQLGLGDNSPRGDKPGLVPTVPLK